MLVFLPPPPHPPFKSLHHFLILKKVYVNEMLLGDINKYCFKMAKRENCNKKILILNFL